MRFVLDEQSTRDGLKVWHQLRERFNGENDIPDKIDNLLRALEIPYTDNLQGGVMGYIDHILHIIRQIESYDLRSEYHPRYTERMKMHIISRRFAGTRYGRITYDYRLLMEKEV
jgi:hypothetical protein